MIKIAENLTKRQKRFLCCYAMGKSFAEAAAFSGIAKDKAVEEGMKILAHPKAAEFFSEISRRLGTFSEVNAEKCLDRLITGSVNDAVILATSSPEELTDETIGKLDLYSVSELKFNKGVCEIKFADRLKAIEKLDAMRRDRAAGNAAQSFLDALSGDGDNGGEDGGDG